MSSVKDFSSLVNTLRKDTANNLLEIGCAFSDAKKKLTETEYKEFLKDTNYVENSSTVRKWQVIGNAYFRLKNICEYLPPVFTTIYKLSRLRAEQLDVLIKNNIIRPEMTTKDISNELNPKSKAVNPPKMTIRFNQNVTEQIVKEINNFLAKYDMCLEIKSNEKAKELIEAINQRNYLTLIAA